MSSDSETENKDEFPNSEAARSPNTEAAQNLGDTDGIELSQWWTELETLQEIDNTLALVKSNQKTFENTPLNEFSLGLTQEFQDTINETMYHLAKKGSKGMSPNQSPLDHRDPRSIPLVLLPVVGAHHIFLFALDLKTPSFVIIDNLAAEAPISVRYGQLPKIVIQFFSTYLSSVSHTMAAQFATLEPYALEMEWRTQNSSRSSSMPKDSCKTSRRDKVGSSSEYSH
ncbi:hypothetical protein L1887_18077 [Cichorium endivia]|nr:hypothetical protein L1887_18077 [Cichorium endivia]